MGLEFISILKVIPDRKEDKGSVFFLAFGIFAVCILSFVEWYYKGQHFTAASYFGTLLVGLGFAMRWSCEAALDKRHIMKNILQKNLVTYGLFKSIRHPCYLGAFLILFGIGLFFSSFWGLAALFSMLVPVGLYRINLEERALLEHFGKPYKDYCKRTYKLIPKIY